MEGDRRLPAARCRDCPEKTLQFVGGSYGGPWAITDYRASDGRTGGSIAVSANHFQWWPGLVTVLDASWNRLGTFVNAGWVRQVFWAGPERLVISGFSNARNGGMVALLDVRALDGQSPTDSNHQMRCTSCGQGAPLRYIVLPRSELNLVTSSPLNGAIMDTLPDRIVIYTEEMPPVGAQATAAVYEFTPELELLNASYGDRYWERHAALEREGRITHTREHCPERGGPRQIEVWEPAAGWKVRRLGR